MARTTLAANASPSQSWNTSTRQQNKSFLSVSLHVLSFLNNLFQHQQSRENVSNTLITSLPLLLLSKQARVCRAWMGPLPPWSLTRGGSLTLRSSAEWSPTCCCRARGMTLGFLYFFLFLCSTTNLTLNNFYVDISQHRSLIIILNKCTRTSCRAPSAWCRSAWCGGTWAGCASSYASSPGTSSWAARATWWTGSAGTAPRSSSACSRSTLPARTSTLPGNKIGRRDSPNQM